MMAFKLKSRGVSKKQMNALAVKYGRKSNKQNADLVKIMINLYIEFIYLYFDNPRRKLKKIFFPVIMANLIEKGSINSVIDEFRDERKLFSHSYTMRILNQLDENEALEMNQLFRKIILKILKRKNFSNKGFIVAVDVTIKPFYGNHKLSMAKGCKNKDGTNQGLHYLSASIVEEGVRFNLMCVPISSLCNINRRVEYLINEIKKDINISLIFLDRAFGNSIYSKIINDLGLKFCTPFTKNDKLKEIEMCIKSQFSVEKEEYNLFILDYVFYENRPKEYQEKTRLVILHEDDCVHFFMTNIKGISMKDYYNLVAAYRYRWGIETNYRMDNIFTPTTSSIKSQIRYLLMQVSLIFEDLWTLLNYFLHNENKRQPREKFKGDYSLVSVIKSRIKDIGFIWRPIITAIQFKRKLERIFV